MIVKGSYGIQLVIKTGTDLSGATGATVKIKTPSGQTVTRNAEVSATPTNGQVLYTTIEADFRWAGPHTIQVAVQFGGAKQIVSEPVEVDVEEGL